MNFLKSTKTICVKCLLVFVLCLGGLPTYSYAQTETDGAAQPSLSDILNPKEEKPERDVPITPALLSNDYFKSCIAKESLAFSDFEKELLCGCVSAKMSELLEVDDFRYLESKTARGRDVRSNILAFAYAPCMEYPIEAKVKDDCMVSPDLQEIVSGKEVICKCATNKFTQYLHDHANAVFLQAQKYEPTTLNPLEYYIVNLGYYSLVKKYTQTCKYNVMYEREN
ncbi:MAG: hypothetical protein ACRBDL_09310 [Alphaproteobacteria bacterium]